MEAEAEIHRSVGNGIVDEIIKPIKSLVEAQSKAKKQIEQGVDKKAKVSARNEKLSVRLLSLVSDNRWFSSGFDRST